MRDVEHDGVGRRGGQPVERRGAVRGERHVVALERQRALQRGRGRPARRRRPGLASRAHRCNRGPRAGKRPEARRKSWRRIRVRALVHARSCLAAAQTRNTVLADRSAGPPSTDDLQPSTYSRDHHGVRPPPACRRATHQREVDDDCIPDVKLLVSELVTNSVKYGGEGAMRAARSTIDRSAQGCAPRSSTRDVGFVPGGARPADDEAGGWGLHLVQTLADRWGVTRARPRLVRDRR